MELTPELQTIKTWSKGQGLWLIGLLVFLSGLLVSCDDEGGRVLPAYTGRAAEVIVIMPDKYWESASGDTVRAALQRPFPSLPQLEPTFTLIHADPAEVSFNYRTHRNVIVVDIEDNVRNQDERAVQVESRWSNGQTVYTFHALSEKGFIKKFMELKESVIADIRAKDRERIKAYVSNVEHPGIGKQLQEKMGLSLTVHREYKLNKLEKDFAWMTREHIQYLSGTPHDVVQGIVVYTQPYTSDSLFEYEAMIASRNANLSGNVLSVYDNPMKVETLIPPTYEQIDFKGHFAIAGRGLWRFDRPIMGGPFVSLTVVDQKNGRLITVDGYVFAPKFDKRNFMLDVEAIVYSLTF